MSDHVPDSQDLETRPAKPGAWRAPALLIVVLLAAGALVTWYALQRESPSIVVQRFCSALKGKRWQEAYPLIDWPAENKIDEKTFVQLGKTLGALYTVQKYTLGTAQLEGDSAVVPVNVTVSVTSFTGTKEVTDDIDIRCRFIDGEWKVRPDLKQGFLGLGKINLPGLK